MASCPAITDWKRLLRGDIAESDADVLEIHLDSCGACQRLVGGLKVEDSLAQGVAKEPLASEDLLPGLIQRVKGVLHSSSATHLVSAQASEELEQLRIQLADGSRLGQHRLIRHLGTGGMGVVFEAEDEELKRRVAVKIMKPALAASSAARQRFLREVQAMAALDHPHIVRIHQVGEDEGRPFCAMEFLCGETLADRLRRTPRLPAKEIASVGRQVALALAAAHERGLIHRDIKPGNIFLESVPGAAAPGLVDCRVKLLDFGLVHAVDHDARLTRAGDVLGTPDYMSPEQARGHRVDARSDLFSLGCVLYELCSGFTPYQVSNSPALLVGMDATWPRPLDDLNPTTPPALGQLIARLLAKNPDDRPSSAQEVEKILEAIERGAPLSLAGNVKTRSQRRMRAELLVPAMIVTLAIVSLLVLSGFFTSVSPLTGSWSRGDPLAQPRTNTMAAEVDGLIYLVSGDPTDLDDPKQRRLDTLEAFDPKTATWKSLASLPKVDDGENGRSSGTVGVIDGKIYLAGGWRHKPPLPTKTLLIYDPPTNSWEGDEGMPSICGDSVGGVIGRKFYVLNGTNGQDGIRHLFYVYDPDRKTWEGRKSAHEPHGHGAGEVIGGKLYVVGGDNGNGPSGGLEVYDPGTDRWTSLAPMPTPRVRAAAAVISGRLVVLGGNNGKSTLATVEAYDPRTDLWTTLPDLPESRQGAAAAVVGSRLYVMGGQRLGSNLKAFDVFTLSKSR